MTGKFPIGIQDFRKVIKEGYIYVDKTLMIKQILDDGASVYLYTRPRRFGKTINLSMLDYFFNIKYKEEVNLFDGLLVSDYPECLKHRSKYPIIRLDLSTITCSSFKDVKDSISQAISKMMTEFDYLEKEQLTDWERKTYMRLSSGQYDTENLLASSISDLSLILQRVHNIAPIIIFDEYDFCIQRTFQNKDYGEIIGFMSNFFRMTFKSNTNFSFGIVSGILRTAKEGLFSGLNSLDVCDIFTDRFDEFFGFTQEEVTELAEKCGMPDITGDLKEWYDGYRFGSKDVYNPWSIMNCLKNKGKLSYYWVNSGSTEIIEDLIMRNRKEGIADDIISIVADPEKIITEDIAQSITFRDLLIDNNSPETLKGNLHSLLVTSGYLKAIPHGNMYDLSIPNKEVLKSYDGLISRSLGLNRKDQSKLYSYLVSKDSASTEKELDRLFSPGSIRDEWSHNDYKHALMILFQYMGYDNVTEKESGDGYIDIYVYPTENQPAVAIEIKITKTSKKLSTLAEDALKQIEKRDYITDYNDTIACGMAFNKTKSCVKIR